MTDSGQLKRVGVLIVVALGVLPALTFRHGDAETTTLVRAVSGALQAGQTITLPVEVLNVQSLGAVNVIVGYDRTALVVAGCRRGAAFDLGLCNLVYDSDGDGQPDAVRFNLVSLTGVSAVGENPLNLANITWTARPHLSLAVTSVLTVQVQTFTDLDAIPLEVAALNGQLAVTIPHQCWLPLMLRQTASP